MGQKKRIHKQMRPSPMHQSKTQHASEPKFSDWIKRLGSLQRAAETLYRVQQTIQRAGSYGNQAYREIQTKHQKGINIIFAARRDIVAELERELTALPDAVKPRIQKIICELRKTKKKPPKPPSYAKTRKTGRTNIYGEKIKCT